MRIYYCPALLTLALALGACSGPQEAMSVEVPVRTDPSMISETSTDLGYSVQLDEARVMIENLEFVYAGEHHHVASWWHRASELVVPTAYAHPGHGNAGDVTGELRGRFELDWLAAESAPEWMATLLVGSYATANFVFTRANEADGILPDDPLLGHTAMFRGTARRDSSVVEFSIFVDAPEGQPLVGASFEQAVDESSTEPLGVRLLTVDERNDSGLFDGLDFQALDEDEDGQLSIVPDSLDASVTAAHNRVLRELQAHGHFEVVTTRGD
ncbi:MAG: hypothetical protein B7733_07315 [Myxococcales bacterium FL481]|nr:MAG: hypothetical protein B7733_07315 [Myxococcales bacterium FL481]